MKLCAIIPSYNHSQRIQAVIDAVSAHGLDIFVIDDGSDEPHKKTLAALSGITLHRLPLNGGKGAAVIAGLELAQSHGYSHALQIDADGQHDVDAIPSLIAMATANPEAVITGQPIYDDSIPTGRKIGRWMTHIWVWIETLSFKIKDSMCGFRIYPIDKTVKIIQNTPIGRRMDFDTDILVRLYWSGVDILSLPVRVIYPKDNTSNFRLWEDNRDISKMHTRLFFEMVFNLKSVIQRNKQPATSTHWASISERGGYWGLKFCAFAYQLLGKTGCQIVLAPIVFYFYLFATKQRRASKGYLGRALGHTPSFWEGFYHFWNFAMKMLHNFSAWQGKLDHNILKAENPVFLNQMATDPRGAVIIVSHLGNADLSHLLLDEQTRKRLVILMHSLHNPHYMRLIAENSKIEIPEIIQVSEMGPETIINLKQHVENGRWIVIAGDRPSVTGTKSVSAEFLGHNAPFATGPYILASMMECPVYLLFCVENQGHYLLSVEPFADMITLPRSEREQALQNYAAQYAKRLEHFARKTPYQWFNFFDFWSHL